MSIFALIVLAVGLCFDTFAVSISGGICAKRSYSGGEVVKIISFFGAFQAGLTLAGWALGSGIRSIIESFDHWVAFGLLLVIGGNMIRESLSSEETGGEMPASSIDLLDTKRLILLSVATSIDAFAVGISLSVVLPEVMRMLMETLIILVITAAASFIGLKSGRIVGLRAGRRSGIAGGIILVLIGIKILVEHLS